MLRDAIPSVSGSRLLGGSVAVGGGAVAGLIAVPYVGTFVGMLVGGLLFGLVSGSRPLIEGSGVAVVAKLGIIAAAGVPGVGLSGATTALGSIGPWTLALSLGFSAAAGGFGTHLGADLRDGITTPLDRHEPDTEATPSTDSTSADSSSSVEETPQTEREAIQ